jgi:CRP-like cAMP-binding protein
MATTAAPRTPETNRLLAVLPAAAREHLYSHLEPVSMTLGEVVYESGSRQDYVYFPTTAIVSTALRHGGRPSAEIAVVGNEGMVGVALFMGGETTPSRAIVQSAGAAYRLSGHLMKEEFIRGGAMQHLLLRYTQALLTQMAQTAVCNRHHSVDQQLCRWLLLSLDRLPSNKLTMTQELIANMLGVRREGTEAAETADAGLIRYSRGASRCWIVRDWRRACECHDVVGSPIDAESSCDVMRVGAVTVAPLGILASRGCARTRSAQPGNTRRRRPPGRSGQER